MSSQNKMSRQEVVAAALQYVGFKTLIAGADGALVYAVLPGWRSAVLCIPRKTSVIVGCTTRQNRVNLVLPGSIDKLKELVISAHKQNKEECWICMSNTKKWLSSLKEI